MSDQSPGIESPSASCRSRAAASVPSASPPSTDSSSRFAVESTRFSLSDSVARAASNAPDNRASASWNSLRLRLSTALSTSVPASASQSAAFAYAASRVASTASRLTLDGSMLAGRCGSYAS